MNKKAKTKIVIGLIFSFILILSVTSYFVIAKSLNPSDNRTIGYEFLNSSGDVVGETDATVVHMWNTKADYFFNKSSGIQFTNYFEDYWTKNIFCIFYYDGVWKKVKCADDLNNFNKDIKTDNLTYVNATLWKDISFGGYDLRLAIRYHLKLNDEWLSVGVSGKNIDTEDIPFDLGFVWRVKEIGINNSENDRIAVNDSLYNLDENLNFTFEDVTYFVITERDGNKFIKLRWDENLDTFVELFSDGNQSNARISLLINASRFSAGQEKSTTIFWKDPEGDFIDSFDLGEIGNQAPIGITKNNTFFWIVDNGGDEVFKYYINGTYTGIRFDTDAEAGNTFPVGITDNDTFFWIADLLSDEVFKYWMNGTYTGIKFDIFTNGNANPRGMTNNDTFIWIVDDLDDLVYKYEMDGTYTGTTFDTAASGNDVPRGITHNGTFFWIVDGTGDEVYKYWMNGTYTGISFDTAADGTLNPTGIENNNTFIWVTDSLTDKVYKYWMNGTYANETFDTLEARNRDSLGVTTNSTFIWATDQDDDKVYKYYMNGTYTDDFFDLNASGNNNPQGITHNGTFFWIVDSIHDDIYKYYMNGTYTGTSWALVDSQPSGITVNNTFIWVTDIFAREVYKYEMDGTYTGISFDTEVFGANIPGGITNNGTFFWITDTATDEVYKVWMNGTYAETSFDTAASGNSNPKGLTHNGTFFWLVDNTFDKIFKYEGPGSPVTSDTCTYTSGNWVVNCADNCIITSNVVGDGSNFSCVGTGTFTINANISNFSRYTFGGACNATCTSVNGCIKI